MEKNGMNKEVMILIELQTLLLKLEFKFLFFFFLHKLSYKKKMQQNAEAIYLIITRD